MASNDDSKARRTAIRIVVFLGVLITLSCLGGVTLFQSGFGDLKDGLTEFDAEIAESLPEGAVWHLAELSAARDGEAPTDGIHLVLVLGVPEGASPDTADALRAELWNTYCDAFEAGGLGIGSVAVGRSGRRISNQDLRSNGAVTLWEDNVEDVVSLSERTGRPAPPDLLVVRWFGKGIDIRDDG